MQNEGAIARFFLWLGDLRGRHGRMTGQIIVAVIAVAAALAAAGVALILGYSTPVRFVEALSEDLRMSLTAPPATRPITIVKIDDAAVNAMRDASPCHCLSPIDKIWLSNLIATLDRKGARAIALDYLIDTWRTPQELSTFKAMVAHLHAPLVAVVDPSLKPGVDFQVVPGVRYADARALVSDDYDDVVRRYDPWPTHLKSLASELTLAMGGRPPNKPFVIRYRRPDPTVSAENAGALAPSYSAAYVDALPDTFFKDRIVFIGRTTRAMGADADSPKEDMHMTPLRFMPGHYAGTPGVEVHAHAFDQMMQGDKLTPLNSRLVAIVLIVAALTGGLLGQATLSWWLSTLLILAGLGLTAVADMYVFRAYGVIAPMATPALAFVLGFFVLSRVAAVRLNSERAFYSSTLERYLSPSVIDRIVSGSEPLRLGGAQREITVLISDLENFSTLVAETPLADFSKVMNDYLGELTEILWKHEALIDKMTGDGIVAIFGAPVEQPDHAQRALACARDIDAFAEAFRERSVKAGFKVRRTRIGLNSGLGLVGNFGGDRRFNYTAYGQVVVIAARLENANKEFDTRILFSAATRALLGDIPDARAVGEIKLKGVEQPIAAYTIIDPIGPAVAGA
jgi:class 3 adenylate cyclase/CHASE2 domain-containing sensor protein